MLIVHRRSARTRSLRPVAGRLATAGSMLVVAIAFAVPSAGAATTPTVQLGTSAAYAVLSGASVGNTVSAAGAPHTTLRGGLAVKANAQPLGFPPGVVTGSVDIGNAAADQAHADATAAYNEIAARTTGAPLPGALAGTTIAPGLYTITGAASNTTTVTLDAGGNPDAVFVFQVGGALAVAAGSHVVLANGARASNVFWQVNGAGAVGANSTFAGTMIALNAVAIGNGSTVNGRAFALTGALTLDADEFYSAPPRVAINGGASDATSDTTPTISGTTDVDAPALVTVTINGQTLTATPAGGAWSVTAAILANATYPVVASVTDGASNTSNATQALTIDTVLPIVTLTGGPSVTTNDPTPTIGGTSDVAPGTIVLVGVGTQTLTALVQPGGTWNVTPAALPDGVRSVTAAVLDPAGNAGLASQLLTIDTLAPAISMVGGASALTNDPTPTISGTADVPPGTTVTVSLADETLSGVVQIDASWAVTADALSDGPHRVIVTVSDPAGNPSSLTQMLTVDTVSPVITISGGASSTTVALDPTISGSTDAPPGTIVTVTIAGQTMTTVVQANGSWNGTPAPIGEGVWTVAASVSDRAGNVGRAGQSLVVAAAHPPAPAGPGPIAPVAQPFDPALVLTPSSPQAPTPPTAPGGGSGLEQLATTTITPDGVQKLAGAALSIGTKVTAPAGTSLTVTAHGRVRIAGVAKTIMLTTRTRVLAAGRSGTLKIAPVGTARAARATCARIRAAIAHGKKVTATITLTLVDAAGHTRVVRRLVELT